MENDLEL
jgi:hypothetical protein